jgi:hypothetical protein
VADAGADANDGGGGADADAGPSCGKGTLKGLVCQAGTMKLVPEATIQVSAVRCDGVTQNFEAKTDEQGRFTIFGVPDGLQRVDVISPLYTGWFWATIKDGGVTFVANIDGCGVAAPDEKACEFGQLRGNVCPVGGSTLVASGFRVWVLAKGCDGADVVREANTTPNGEFTLTKVPPGTHVLRVDRLPAFDPQDLYAEWTTTVKIEPSTLTDAGSIGAVSCGGLPAVDSGGSGSVDTGELCTDPKWNLCGDAILDYCANPTPPFPDCNSDGIPDPCPLCPPLEVVFALDTSGSMFDELDALCTQIEETVTKLGQAAITTQATVLGISETYGCLKHTVVDAYGSTITDGPEGWTPIGFCGDSTEDWALAVGVIAANKPWLENSVRVIVPISDEGPACGDPLDALDGFNIDLAIEVAKKHGVIVFPITGTGAVDEVVALAEKLATATGGTTYATTNATADMATSVIMAALNACNTFSDCNSNGVPDDCDIANGKLTDFNLNGKPDACE